MFCSRTSNNMTNKIHDRVLQETLMQCYKTNDTCNHHRNIQTLMIEIYKIKKNLNPPIMDFMFEG